MQRHLQEQFDKVSKMNDHIASMHEANEGLRDELSKVREALKEAESDREQTVMQISDLE